MREEFEKWASAPPLELPLARMPEDHGSAAWPGQYRMYETQLAAEAYQAGALAMRERAAKAVVEIGDVVGNWPDAVEGDKSNVRAVRTIMQDAGNGFAAAIRALPVSE